MQILSWNVKQLDVGKQLADSGVDVALLQEVRKSTVPAAIGEVGGLLEWLPADDAPWGTTGCEVRPWRTAIVRLSPQVELRPIPMGDMFAGPDTLSVSRPGTLTAATVTLNGRDVFVAVSAYSPWERPLSTDAPIWADASAHRILSDLAPLVGRRLPLLIAGDWNILRGYGEYGDGYWGARYQTVFDRAEAMGLEFVGPEHPHGRRADPWPDELPVDSTCVPTFCHSRQTPETATRQLDFVFASRRFAPCVHVTALNDPDDWGPSDHCQVLIDIDV